MDKDELDKNSKLKKEKKHKKDKKNKDEKKRKKRHDSDSELESDYEAIQNKKKKPSEIQDLSINKIESNSSLSKIDNPIEKSISREDFFAKILSTESRKPSIGTFHSRAPIKEKVLYENKVSNSSGEWKCAKCTTLNVKLASFCTKCRSMKRLGQ